MPRRSTLQVPQPPAAMGFLTRDGIGAGLAGRMAGNLVTSQ
jgi:hypothetical protein